MRGPAQRLDAPHIELDVLYWAPGWVPHAPAVFRALVGDAIASERWVLDGNYRAVRDVVWRRATSVVWLDYPFARVVWQVLTRTLARSISREELFGGNRESLSSFEGPARRKRSCGRPRRHSAAPVRSSSGGPSGLQVWPRMVVSKRWKYMP